MFSKLRHPFQPIQEPLGTAGLIVAAIALIAALGGSALASGGLTSKVKTEIKKYAKQYAKQFAVPGSQGLQGPSGPQGAPGANGKNGTTGANGKSAIVTPISSGGSECEGHAGAMVEEEGEPSSATEVCEGSPWTAGGTLPAGETETGAYGAIVFNEAAGGPGEGFEYASATFAIPLSTSLDADHVKVAPDTNCPGSSEAPAASAGYLCVYPSPGTLTPLGILKAANSGQNGASTAGAAMSFFGEGQAIGTFAVTAPCPGGATSC